MVKKWTSCTILPSQCNHFRDPSFLRWSSQAMHFLQDTYENFARNLLLSRMLQGTFFEIRRRPASIGIVFAQWQILWSTFANIQKRDYCFESSSQRFSTNINFITDFYILCIIGGVIIFLSKILSHSTEKFLCSRKILVLKIFMHKRGVSRFSVVLMTKVKKCMYTLGFESIPSASEPCCPTNCAMGTIGVSDKCQWNRKNLWPDRDSNLDLLLENSSPHRTAQTIYLKIKIVGKNTLMKRPHCTEWIIFFAYLTMRRKIIMQFLARFFKDLVRFARSFQTMYFSQQGFDISYVKLFKYSLTILNDVFN